MLRFSFFLLLLANVALGVHVYLSHTAPPQNVPPEINRDALKIISAVDPSAAQRDASAAKQLAASLAGASCVAFGVKPTDAPRAQAQFAALNLGTRLETRNVEETTRFGVALPAQRDRRSAETVVANLKRAGVADFSILSDNAISLGVFSTEETASRHLAELRERAASQLIAAEIVPRSSSVRETVFTVREADASLAARIALLQRDFAGSTLKPVACATPPTSAVVTSEAGKTTRP